MSIYLSKYKITFLTLCASLLTACGGGGDEQATNVVNTNSQPRILVTDDWQQSARLISTTNNTNVSATVIGEKLNINIQSDSLEHAPHIQVYLDTDNNAVSGFQFENQAWDNSGVDYIIEDGDLFKSTANNTGWNWNTDVGDISYTKTNNNIEIQIDTDLLGNLCNTLNIGLMTRDSDWYVQEFYPVSSRMSNFSISYCQTDGSDTQAPEITLNGANPLRLELNSNYSEAGAIATDIIDGDLSGSISTSTNLDTSKVGTYTVTYSVSDTSGNNSSKTRTVIVSEASSTGITVDGDISDWSSISSFYSTSNGIVKVSDDENTLYLLVNASQLGKNIQFFIDADNSINTGLKLDLAKNEWAAGADYMIENNSLDKSTSNLPIWAWDYTVAPIEFVRTADAIEVAISKSDLANLGETIVIGFISRDADWNVNYAIPEGALNSYTLNSITTEPPVVTAARYRLTFNSTWSIDTHPVNFPQGNPHFSPLVGAVHNSELTLWQPGDIASTGIENMAEFGGTSALISEILDADSLNNSVLNEINGSSIPFSPGSTSLEFDITPEFPEVSFTSMLAPSPDWFVGVHNLNLFENGTFIPNKTISLKLYDAGTDSGVTHTSGNADTQPKQAISLLTSNPTDASFIDGGPVLGTFTFERISLTEE